MSRHLVVQHQCVVCRGRKEALLREIGSVQSHGHWSRLGYYLVFFNETMLLYHSSSPF